MPLMLAALLSPMMLGACDESNDVTVALEQPLGALGLSIVADNLDAAQDLNLLARAEVQPDEILEVYEPRPGLLIVSSAGAPAGAALVTPEALAGKTLEDAWSEFTADAPMPPALEDAALRLTGVVFERVDAGGDRKGDARADATKIDSAAHGGLTAPVSPAAAAGYCDSGWYATGYSDCTFGFHFEDDVTVCLDNWWNGAYASVGDGYYTSANVCPAQGSVALRLRTDEGVSGFWTVAMNTYRHTSVLDSNCGTFNDCPWVRVDVEQASGDRFQFRFLSDIE